MDPMSMGQLHMIGVSRSRCAVRTRLQVVKLRFPGFTMFGGVVMTSGKMVVQVLSGLMLDCIGINGMYAKHLFCHRS